MEEQEVGDEKPPPAKKPKTEETTAVDAAPQQEVNSSTVTDGEEERESQDGDQTLMEKDVGITEYISPQHPGFFAILKQRLTRTL